MTPMERAAVTTAWSSLARGARASSPTPAPSGNSCARRQQTQRKRLPNPFAIDVSVSRRRSSSSVMWARMETCAPVLRSGLFRVRVESSLGELTVVPCGSQHRGERVALAPHPYKDRGELRLDDLQTLVYDTLVHDLRLTGLRIGSLDAVAHVVDQALTGGEPAGGDPRRID